MTSVHMKNPFIDSQNECSNEKCENHGWAEDALRRFARSVANEQEALDRESYRVVEDTLL